VGACQPAFTSLKLSANKGFPMQLTGLVFAGLAAVFHILFFVLESLLWGKPAVNKIFGQTSETVEITRTLAYNQGFYNLFIAIGTLVGVWLIATGKNVAGLSLVTFGCGTMIGAAAILFLSKPQLIRGVLIQGLPPVIALGLLWFAR
jgi:putative membrane protein